MTARRSGMTLVEVLLAVVILGICMLGLMQGISASLEIFNASAYIHEAANVLARGDGHPMIIGPIRSSTSSSTTAPSGGMDVQIIERTRTRQPLRRAREDRQGRGGLGMEEEYVRLIHYAQGAPK